MRGLRLQTGAISGQYCVGSSEENVERIVRRVDGTWRVLSARGGSRGEGQETVEPNANSQDGLLENVLIQTALAQLHSRLEGLETESP